MNELRIILSDEQLDSLAARIADQLAPAIVDRATVAANEQQSYRIDPLRLYDVDEAAAVLGIAPGTLYNMSDQEMPRQGCGRGGGKIKFYGRDLLAHLIKNYTGRRHPHQEPVDSAVKAYADFLGDDYIISEEEASRLLGVSTRTLYRMRKAGEVHSGVIAGKPRYSLGQIRRLMREIVRP